MPESREKNDLVNVQTRANARNQRVAEVKNEELKGF